MFDFFHFLTYSYYTHNKLKSREKYNWKQADIHGPDVLSRQAGLTRFPSSSAVVPSQTNMQLRQDRHRRATYAAAVGGGIAHRSNVRTSTTDRPSEHAETETDLPRTAQHITTHKKEGID